MQLLHQQLPPNKFVSSVPSPSTKGCGPGCHPPHTGRLWLHKFTYSYSYSPRSSIEDEVQVIRKAYPSCCDRGRFAKVVQSCDGAAVEMVVSRSAV
ncbi:hypothetical protein BAUCODRAFT_38496 [Baudoinia panamericana UAMH 10762]|uniref:Uncharacterized protein n=1 Tax=Baudoinia panamericana (strain UAMH 10762) TaxID=717646 RepID=M2LEL1_BAUPA|nr:uncharacterized protein BAUCODRAFT_38496 [Baudoinia panamericana UAMH 10762]EMC92432.1 hypothetical protein BAUCODRAFT_38496 [Baudoinia panamericana UAMH 10762]